MGQIINSINNIYIICEKVAIEKKKKKGIRKIPGLKENDEHLINNMIEMLEMGTHYVSDLTSVFKDEHKFDDARLA